MELNQKSIIPGLTLYYEKVKTKGEDAFPTLLRNHDEGTFILLTVYDGMGGAGSTIYEKENNKTGAAIAAQLAKNINEELFIDLANQKDFNILEYPKKLESNLKMKFREKASEIDFKESRIKSSLIKKLPTTIAGIIADISDIENIKIVSFWAGDSRNYVIDGSEGMMLLSKDDITSKGDSSILDVPLSNCINADTEFYINQKNIIKHDKIILLTVTDGCFGYFTSLLHFEYQILQSLYLSEGNIDSLTEQISNSIKKVTQDDFTLSMFPINFESLEEISKWTQLDKRRKKLEEWLGPIDKLDKQIKEGEEDIANFKAHRNKINKEVWEQYKSGYESLISEL